MTHLMALEGERIAALPYVANDAPGRRELRLPMRTVGDVMTRNVVCVQPDLPLDDLIQLFVEEGFKAIPVVDDEGHLVGMVSESDLLTDAHARRGYARPVVERLIEEADGGYPARLYRRVADVMSPLVFEVQESALLTQVAALMAYEGVHRVVVRGSDGRVVGLVSASDVLFWLAQAAGYSLPSPRRAP